MTTPAELQPDPNTADPTGSERISKSSSPSRKFPCGQCGAKLDFDPAVQSLHCPYCGFQQTIAAQTETVEERDWELFWSQQASTEEQLPGHSSEVTCTACGAVVLLDDKIAADACPYCATHLDHQPRSAQAMIPPGAILPFALTHHQAIAAFTNWIQSRWFAPSQLKILSNLGQLSGVYIPYWTFDAMTFSSYTGQRGDNYTEIEHYVDHETRTHTNAQGVTTTSTQPVSKTRHVTKTRWSYAAGQVDHFFNDILICASHTLPPDLIAKLEPWDLPSLVDFRPEFLSGFQTERYTIGLREGFTRANAVMEPAIQTLCRQDIGGDHQTISSLDTKHTDITFKHLLLPVWIAAFRYRDKPYRILINARTGEVVGTRPYSIPKIASLIAAILVAIALTAFIISTFR
jgi:DNA-directed RNA polymerase subunit RPC12/RpoP